MQGIKPTVTVPSALEDAILRTILYADVFDFALEHAELHHFLMARQPYPPEAVQHALETSAYLHRALSLQDGLITLAGRDELRLIRAERRRLTSALWPKAVAAGKLLSRVPFVRMVALTGALAMHNPGHTGDDFDYFIVTTAGRVWLARLMIVGVVRLSRLWGWPICPNFVLAPEALPQRRRDAYIAHEIAQAVPLADEAGLYADFRVANRWTHQHLPNATTPYPRGQVQPLGRIGRGVKHLLEWILGGRVGSALESWEQRRKLRRFATQAQAATSAAQLDSAQAKGHFIDHGSGVLAQYRARLHTYGLTEESADLAAD
jgi:hypothetical protein